MFRKKSQKSDKVSTEATVAGSASTAARSKLNTKMVITATIFAIAVITILISVLLFKNNNANEDVAIKVGKTTISTSQYQSMLEDFHTNQIPLVYSDEEYKQFVIDVLQKREVAGELGIATSEDAIKTLASSRYCTDIECGEPTVNQMLAAESEIYEINISNIEKGNKRVARFIFPCSQHYAAWQERPPADFGNLSVIEADKVYADEQARQTKDALANNLNYDTAAESIKSVLNDPKLSYGYSANNSEIFYLDAETGEMFTEDNSKEILNEADMALLANQAKGVTDIYEMNGAASMSGVPGYGKDGVLIAYYFYTVIDSPSPNNAIREEVENKANEIKVVSNV